MLISDAINKYTTYLEAAGRAYRTIQSARERLKHFQNFIAPKGITDLDDLTPEVVDEYIVSLRRRHLSKVTISGRQQALKALLQWCVVRGYTDRNPAAHLKKPRLDFNARSRAIAPKDLEAMIHAAHAQNRIVEEIALMLLADTGCRAGELCSIRLSDIDHQRREITVRGKTGRRIVDYTQKTANVLKRYLHYRARHAAPEVNALLINYKGEAATTNMLYLRFRELARPLKITRFNPQSIRHRVGQGWVDAGANLELVRLKLGHKDITTTSLFYANQDRERIKKATEKYSLLQDLDE